MKSYKTEMISYQKQVLKFISCKSEYSNIHRKNNISSLSYLLCACLTYYLWEECPPYKHDASVILTFSVLR